MSVILGLNAYHASASAALVVNGRIVAAIPEERLNRVKYYAGFPHRAVAECLHLAGLTLMDVEHVALGRDTGANLARKLHYVVTHLPHLANFLQMRMKKQPLRDVRAVLGQQFGMDPARFKFSVNQVEHHLAHTASSYYTSAWEHAAGITIDGSGDFVTVMMSECRGGEIVPKHRIHVPHSLGSLYSMVCEFIGFSSYGDEGKVMGLAPYGRDRHRAVFDEMLRLTDEGFELNPRYFQEFGANSGFDILPDGSVQLAHAYTQHLVDRMGPARAPGAELTEREHDLAFGVQAAFERAYLHMLRLLHRRTPVDRVVMAGGCLLNSVANGKVFAETPFRATAIHPAAGDDGLAVGAALYVSQALLHEPRREQPPLAYLGPAFAEAEIAAELARRGLPAERLEPDALIRRAVDEIESGNVLGWFQGRMEWGPRALGARSILAHPGRPDMKAILNARIKHREPFRPFAPAVLAERQAEVFEHDHPSPYMLHVYRIRPEWRERLCAVNHVDGTGRLQSVARSENPLYYDLIAEFARRTGIPVVLNTSFNENEPIVCTPAEAIDCYLRTRMDALAIGPFFTRKPA